MNIFSLTGEVLLKDSGVNEKLDSIDKKAGQTDRSVGSSFKSMAGAAIKLGAVLGVGLGIKEMISSAAKSQQVLAQMGAVLKSTGGAAGMSQKALVAFADSQAKVTMFSKSTTEAGENLLLTFTGIGKKVFPDTMKAAENMSTAMGTDLNSTVLTLGKALNSPADGLTKLTKQGVTFSAQQKTQITGMIKAGNAAGAQAVMLKELNKEFGNSAIAAGKTFNGALKILQNQMADAAGTLGKTLLPYMNKFITTVIKNMPMIQSTIKSALGIIVPQFQKWISLIAQIAEKLMPNFSKSTDGVKGSLGTLGIVVLAITGTLTFLNKNITLVRVALVLYGLSLVAVTGYHILQNAQVVISNGLILIAATRSKLETAQVWLMIAADKAHLVETKLATIATTAASLVQRTFMNTIVAGTLNIIRSTASFVANTASKVAGGIATAALTVKSIALKGVQLATIGVSRSLTAAQWLFNASISVGRYIAATAQLWLMVAVERASKIATAATTAAQWLFNAAISVGRYIATIAQLWLMVAAQGAVRAATAIATAAQWLFNAALDANPIGIVVVAIGILVAAIVELWQHSQTFRDIITGVWTVLKTVWDGITKGFTGIVKNALTWGGDIINGIIKGIKGAAADLAKGVGGIINDVKTAFTKGFGIASPAKWFIWAGGHMMGGLIKGMTGSNVKKFAEGLVGSIKGSFSGLTATGGQLSGWLTEAMTLTGTPMSQYADVMKMIMSESSGNPNAINLTDSNAKAGHPSRGLLQTIPSTFEKWRSKSLPDNIVNPLANLVAGLNYIKGTYGSASNTPGMRSEASGGGYKGYAIGSRYIPYDQVAQIHKGEMIVPKSENPYANSGGQVLPNTGSKQSMTIQLVLNNGKAIAEYLIEDIDKLQGNRLQLVARGSVVR